MNIREVIGLIPEEPTDEALMAISSITIRPAEGRARLTVHPANKFLLWLQVQGLQIEISAEGRQTVSCSPKTFLSALRREIYEIDEAISSGSYRQIQPKMTVIDMPSPPADMEIPVWDDKTGRWHDAEY